MSYFLYLKHNTIKMIIRFCCLILLFLCSCGHSPKQDGAIRVSVLRGPSAIAFAGWMEKAPVIEGKPIQVKVIDSPDLMQAVLIKGETDIAVLPMISAANLYNKGIKYPLWGCPVWGTLYLVGQEQKTETNTTGETLHIFGAGTTPDILTRHYLQQHHLHYSLNYTFSTAHEIMQGLLAGKIKTAVIGEPFLSMALKKDSTLHILADLNYQNESTPGFAQTAILCTPSLKKRKLSLDSLLQASCSFATENPEQAIHILEDKQVFAPGMLTKESIERCKIEYYPVAQSRKSIQDFLKLIEEYEPKALGGKLPDAGFYN